MANDPAHLSFRGPIGVAFVFSIFTNLLMLTGPLFMLQIYDRVLSARSQETLVALFVLVAGLYLLYWFLEFARARVMSRVAARYHSNTSGDVFDRVVQRSALKVGPGNGRLADIEAVRSYYSSPLFLSMMDAPWTPVFLAAIFIFHPMLGWLAVAGGSIIIVVAILNQVLTFKKTKKSGALAATAQHFANKVEASSDYIWAQGMKPAIKARWTAMQDDAVSQHTRSTDWTGAFTSFTRAFRLFLQSAMLALGAWLVLSGELTAGAMIAASIILGRALAPIESGVSQWAVFQRARSARKDLAELENALPKREEPTELPPPAAKLTVKKLSILIDRRDKPVLRDISFALSPGEALGVIGKSGSGKSTLARAIVGLHPPTVGEIRIDGVKLDQYPTDRLGQYIGYLPQEVKMLPGTVAENIARMQLDPDASAVVAAAKRARVHDIILNLPKGYDTPLGGGEVQLSGGQTQRLALARALFGDPTILILDEPNSALDSDGSEALNAAVIEMTTAGKAVMIMTHRPAAITTCANLLVLENGQVSGYGPRDAVLEAMVKNAADVQRLVRKAN